LDRFLFVGAHPDDIEFGAGATLAKALASNVECHALVLSDCHESLNDSTATAKKIVLESKSALDILGLREEHTNFLNFPVRNFHQIRQEILQCLIDKARTENYSRIYVPASFDVHQDHHVVFTESLRAFKFSTILGYELPWNSFDGELRNFNILDLKHVQLKKIALQEFHSQRSRFYSGDEKIEITLKFRGLQINVDYAEAFEVLRWIEH
jgi:LmbE family N-acetylglucosaminyl deacetylase